MTWFITIYWAFLETQKCSPFIFIHKRFALTLFLHHNSMKLLWISGRIKITSFSEKQNITTGSVTLQPSLQARELSKLPLQCAQASGPSPAHPFRDFESQCFFYLQPWQVRCRVKRAQTLESDKLNLKLGFTAYWLCHCVVKFFITSFFIFIFFK